MGVGSAAWSAYKTIMGAVGSATMMAGKTIFNAGYNNAPQAMAHVGSASAAGASKLADAAMEGTAAGIRMAVGAGSIMSKFIDYDVAKYGEKSLFNSRLTKGGMGLVYGTGLLAGTVGAYHDYENRQMGTPSGEVVTSTPQINYTHFANFGEEMGATGDLVFAMNRNRRRGIF